MYFPAFVQVNELTLVYVELVALVVDSCACAFFDDPDAVPVTDATQSSSPEYPTLTVTPLTIFAAVRFVVVTAAIV